MFIDIYNTFCCKYMKLIGKCKKIIGKYLNWLEVQIPAFRAFCKTCCDAEQFSIPSGEGGLGWSVEPIGKF